MPKRYIDAVKMETRIKELFPDIPKIDFMNNIRNWREKNKQYLQCLDVIRSLPTADVVEVVGCKDCKHGILTETSDERYCWLHRMCHFEDYYCADGRRKETKDVEDIPMEYFENGGI